MPFNQLVWLDASDTERDVQSILLERQVLLDRG